MVIKMNYYFSNQYSDELYHYGVKGMKWGIRKQIDAIGNRRLRQQTLSPEQRSAIRRKRLKRAAIVGGTVAIAGLSIYGVHKYKSLSREMTARNNSIKLGRTFVEGLYKQDFNSGHPNAPLKSTVTYLGNDFKYHTATKNINGYSNLGVTTQNPYSSVREYARAKKNYLGHY